MGARADMLAKQFESKAGELLWLCIDVQGSPSAEENKREAIELGKLGAARI